MQSKSIKTHFDRNVFLTFLVLLIGGFSLLSFKMNSKVDCSNVGFDIIASSYTTEDLIEFKSTDGSGVDWSWDFGDETAPMFRSNVVHQFAKPGKYKISLEMNGQCKKNKELVIYKRKVLISPELVPTINLPKNVRVGDEVTFSNDSRFAKSWQWSFGETMAIDGRDSEEKYTFKRPGEKTILLVVNNDQRHGAKQRITVLPEKKKKRRRVITRREDPIETVLQDQIASKPQEEDPPPTIDDGPKIERIEVSSDKIRQMLVGYSTRTVDDRAIRDYFCYTTIPVFNKSGNRVTVNQLFKEIRDVKIEIKSIALVKDSNTGCIKSMTLDMRVKKGLFWKNF